MSIRGSLRASLTLVALVLVSCGGGGSDEPSTPPPPPAPSALSYSSPQVLTVGQTVAALTPTVTGTVVSYGANPALPAGLSMNTTSGVISGMPSAVTAAANYTITATNSSGSSNATLSITVNDRAPQINYGSSATRAFTTGVPITELVPDVSGGGAPVGWSVNPALPAGLVLNTTNGHVTGTPTEVSAASGYVVTTTNTGGQSQTELSISVESGVLLELGHADAITLLRLTATRALSQDDLGHWVLWDFSSGDMLASGDTACPNNLCGSGHFPVDLAGPTVVVASQTGLEVRAATDGHVLSTIATQASWWKVAADGSYVAAGNSSGVTAWSPTGTVLFTRAGDYSHAVSFAAAGELRIALGTTAANVIETLSVPAGTSSSSTPFSGQFNSWFVDGERFLTAVSNTVWVYSKAVVQLDIAALPSTSKLTGQGDWFWSVNNDSANVYRVGASSSAAGTFTHGVSTRFVASGTTLGVIASGEKQLTIVDLSTVTLSSAQYNLPNAYLETYASNASGDWLVGNRRGVVLDGPSAATTPRYLGFGKAWSISGSSTRVVIATASGSILYFNADTKAEEGRIEFPSSDVQLSSNGTVLAAMGNAEDAQYYTDRSLKVYSLPAGSETQSWPYTYPTTPYLNAISLSGSGTALAQSLVTGALSYEYQVSAATGGAPLWSESHSGPQAIQPIRFSPNGVRWTVPTTPPDVTAATNVFTSGALTSAVPAWAFGWIDDEHFLANSYFSAHIGSQYGGAAVYDSAGLKGATPALPELRTFQLVSPGFIYSPALNSIFSVATGDPAWTSASESRGVGAVAGARVIFASGASIRAEPR